MTITEDPSAPALALDALHEQAAGLVHRTYMDLRVADRDSPYVAAGLVLSLPPVQRGRAALEREATLRLRHSPVLLRADSDVIVCAAGKCGAWPCSDRLILDGLPLDVTVEEIARFYADHSPVPHTKGRAIMRKTPTLFLRDPADRRFVVPEITPGCEWVVAGEGVATRKYDGTCVLFDPDLDPTQVPLDARLHGWWVRREIKPGGEPPAGYQPIEVDDVTGKTVGWEPADLTSFAKYLAQAVEALTDGPRVGSHELIGPRINRNPERVARHTLIAHADAEPVPAPRDFDGLCRWLPTMPYEGVVWHHPDGRMAKAKRRDFRG